MDTTNPIGKEEIMKTSLWKMTIIFLLALSLGLFGSATVLAKQGGGGRPGGEAAGNNLSFPVIWSDGVTKELPGVYGEVNMDGAMWYWWGTDADGNPESCLADPDDTDYCDDGVVGSIGGPAPCNDRSYPCMAVFQQQDSNSNWQAESADWSATPVKVHWIDWGDNLESVDWYTRSKVRTEVVLIQDLTNPMTEYVMKHLSGWGIDELWGLATVGLSWDPDPPVYHTGADVRDGYEATVYSHCARLTIQKLTKPRDDETLSLTWNPAIGEWDGDVTDDGVDPALFNKGVWEGGDGPGYYSAEINVKGKVIYGYTWDVKNLNDKTGGTAAGDYRITFSLDAAGHCPVICNTFFDTNTTILEPVEEEAAVEAVEEEPTGGGAVGVIDVINNLTYIDVRILERSGGKKTK